MYDYIRGERMTQEDLQAELERLKKENEELKQNRRSGSVSMKVSPKGAVSVYGLGRFPVTLYKEQWEKLLGHERRYQNLPRRQQSDIENKGVTRARSDPLFFGTLCTILPWLVDKLLYTASWRLLPCSTVSTSK